jgi:hypothetical protein
MVVAALCSNPGLELVNAFGVISKLVTTNQIDGLYK